MKWYVRDVALRNQVKLTTAVAISRSAGRPVHEVAHIPAKPPWLKRDSAATKTVSPAAGFGRSILSALPLTAA